MGHTVAEQNEGDFLCFLLYLARRLRKSVVTLAVTGTTISSRIFRHGRVPVFQRHRLPLTGNRWEIRWLSSRRTKATFCVFPVFSVAVLERCCDASGDGEYYFRSGYSTGWGAGVPKASIAVEPVVDGTYCA
jgi:hypothetical protein